MNTCLHSVAPYRTHAEILLEMIRKDDPAMSVNAAWDMTGRLLNRPGLPGACVHQMPQGMSSFYEGKCIRCGSEK